MDSIVFQMLTSCISTHSLYNAIFHRFHGSLLSQQVLMYIGSTTFTKFVHLCSRLDRRQIVPKVLLRLQTCTWSWSFFPQQMVQNKHGMLTSSVQHQNIAYVLWHLTEITEPSVKNLSKGNTLVTFRLLWLFKHFISTNFACNLNHSLTVL
jgi:hypothetical protein